MATVNAPDNTSLQGQIGRKSGEMAAKTGAKSGRIAGAPAGKPSVTAPSASPGAGKNTGKNTGEVSGKKMMNTAPSGKSDFRLPEGQDERSVVFRRNARGDGGSGAGGGNAGVGYGAQGRPVITANTRDVGYAMYYKALRKRVESFGLINFPQRNGAKLYGELTVRIPVYRDGALFEKEGGPGNRTFLRKSCAGSCCAEYHPPCGTVRTFPEKHAGKKRRRGCLDYHYQTSIYAGSGGTVPDTIDSTLEIDGNIVEKA